MELTVLGFVYHFAPPLVVGLMLLWVGRILKKGDEQRKNLSEKAQKDRQRLIGSINAVKAQNAWFIRKFVQIATKCNTEHPEAPVDLSDYPNGFNGTDGDKI